MELSSIPGGVSRQHVYVSWRLIDFIEVNVVVYVDNVIQRLRQLDTVTDTLTCIYVMLRWRKNGITKVITIIDKIA